MADLTQYNSQSMIANSTDNPDSEETGKQDPRTPPQTPRPLPPPPLSPLSPVPPSSPPDFPSNPDNWSSISLPPAFTALGALPESSTDSDEGSDDLDLPVLRAQAIERTTMKAAERLNTYLASSDPLPETQDPAHTALQRDERRMLTRSQVAQQAVEKPEPVQ